MTELDSMMRALFDPRCFTVRDPDGMRVVYSPAGVTRSTPSDCEWMVPGTGED